MGKDDLRIKEMEKSLSDLDKEVTLLSNILGLTNQDLSGIKEEISKMNNKISRILRVMREEGGN